MKRNIDLTQEQVTSRLSYNAKTGVLRWRYDPDSPAKWNTRWAGVEAGTRNGKYVAVLLYGKRYMAQRLIWVIRKGSWPQTDIDHRDGDRHNNRWCNLRLATRSQNNANCGMRASNSSGFKGVHWDARNAKWKAQISVRGKVLNLGRYKSRKAAAVAYRIAADKHFGEFARFT